MQFAKAYSPQDEPRNVPVVLPLVVLLLAAVLLIRGFVHTLPYQLDSDEPQIYYFAEYLYQTGSLLHGYPPLRIIELSYEFQVLDWITPGGASQTARFAVARYFSILYALLTVALAYQAGRQFTGPAAGLAAMLFMSAQPEAVSFARIFKVDNLAWLFGMLTLLFTIRAVKKDRPWLIAPALLAVAAATAGKYTMLPLVLMPVLALVIAVPKTKLARGIMIAAAAVLLAVSVWLIAAPPDLLAGFLKGFHARELYNKENLLTFLSLDRAVQDLPRQLGVLNLLVVILGIPLAVFIWPRSKLTRRETLLAAITLATIVSAFLIQGLFWTNRAHDRYLVVLGFALLWGLSIALLAGKRIIPAFGAALLLLAPWILNGWQLGTKLHKPDTRVMTAEWAIDNLPEGTHIAIEADHVEFEPYFGGFPGDKIFYVETITSVYQESLESFARRGIEYLVADFRSVNRGGFYDPDTDNTQFLERAALVLDLDNATVRGWRGPSRMIFQVPPLPQHPMHVILGDEIIFRGYDLPSDTTSPGESLSLVLYWAVLRETDANYTVFAHVLDENNHLVGQLDALPGDPEHRTYGWGTGYFDWDEWPIQIDEGAPPGEYILRIGLYDAETRRRAEAVDADGTLLGDVIILQTITVR